MSAIRRGSTTHIVTRRCGRRGGPSCGSRAPRSSSGPTTCGTRRGARFVVRHIRARDSSRWDEDCSRWARCWRRRSRSWRSCALTRRHARRRLSPRRRHAAPPLAGRTTPTATRAPHAARVDRRGSRGGDRRRSGRRPPGRLVRAVRLPARGAHFRTWDPVHKRSPNRWTRRNGTDDLVRMLLRVARESGDTAADRRPEPSARAATSARRFGPIGHASHQNGLDADVYFPRKDGRQRAPRSIAQVDRRTRPGARRPLRQSGSADDLRGRRATAARPGGRRAAVAEPRRSPALRSGRRLRSMTGWGGGDVRLS